LQATESAILRTGKTNMNASSLKLSTQQVTDCVDPGNGCNGGGCCNKSQLCNRFGWQTFHSLFMHPNYTSAGWPQSGIDYMRNVGITTYASYPYISESLSCQSDHQQ
jgi:hypothetical protein